MIQYNARLNLKNRQQFTPIMLAAAKGDRTNFVLHKVFVFIFKYICFQLGKSRLVEILANAGADVNIQGPNQWSALIFAAYNGTEKIAKILLQHNARTDLKTDQGFSALHWAVLNRELNM